ncbi:MAG: CRISPR-associated helicase Cas3' [Firmicutes bacterium]|nr:CRISPR-associated helicase Cas3' [Bacillota bacterium]
MCVQKLSYEARSLWAKKSRDGSLFWLPLVTHMADSAAVAQKLWDHWLSEGAKLAIVSGLFPAYAGDDPESAEQLAKQSFMFLSAVHDLGKATPVFQAKKTVCSELDRRMLERIQESGLPMKPTVYFARAVKTPHALATQLLLEHAGCDKSIAVILGAHHGKPPDNVTLINCGIGSYAENFHLGKEGKEAWVAIQRELLDFALNLSGFPSVKEIPKPSMAAQVLLSGLVIMADWIASNEAQLPYISLEDVRLPDSKARVELAWELLDLPYPWEADNLWMRSDLYRERFAFTSNTVQSITAQAAVSIRTPGILVLEAPMGVGKTEAALVAAEIFADKAKRKGVFFALPTQATSDGIFPRILKWVEQLDSEELHSMRLMHGKAEFNDVFRTLTGGVNIGEDEGGGVIVHGWFEARKKAMLDDFVVGTIDQLLLAALKQKHVMLRHLGLANKVVIIDECHAYDAYMSQYLNMALSWLGAYRVPVIVLSATLPAKKRQEVIGAYLNIKSESAEVKPQTDDPLGRSRHTQEQTPEWISCSEYPLITFTDGDKIGQITVPTDGIVREVELQFLSEDALLEKLEQLLSAGGCAGIVVNTVKRAQELTRTMSEHFARDAVRLLHSRFLAPDRAEKEKKLLEEMGKPGASSQRPNKRIVIGTQVLEQSLDIDFDVLVTDICPMDLLLQRIGRLHRHERERPEKLRDALCLIIGLDGDSFEAGTEEIYGTYLLMRTKACLPHRLVLPHDISKLVQDVYNDGISPLPESPEYLKSITEHKKRIADKEKRARDFRVSPPWLDGDLSGWLNTYVSDKGGEAAVRDGDESIEVLLVWKKRDGKLYFLPWIENEHELLQNEIPNGEQARSLARCSVRLPAILCAPWMIENTIKFLEDLNTDQLSEWQKSPWLAGELVLILDENFSATLGDYRLVYDQQFGLLHEKEDKPDAPKGV